MPWVFRTRSERSGIRWRAAPASCAGRAKGDANDRQALWVEMQPRSDDADPRWIGGAAQAAPAAVTHWLGNDGRPTRPHRSIDPERSPGCGRTVLRAVIDAILDHSSGLRLEPRSGSRWPPAARRRAAPAPPARFSDHLTASAAKPIACWRARFPEGVSSTRRIQSELEYAAACADSPAPRPVAALRGCAPAVDPHRGVEVPESSTGLLDLDRERPEQAGPLITFC